MCSRYHVDDETIAEIQGMAGIVDHGVLSCSGDIHPSDNAPVIDGSTPGLHLGTMKWGFLKSDGKGLLINARAETAAQKPIFREHLSHRRCAIPASSFYEWDRTKHKAAFSRPDSRLLCFAGVYRVDGSCPRFVILTTEANESILPVHNRMPLIIGRDQIGDWIYDSRQTRTLLRQKIPPMVRQLEQRTDRASELYLFPDFMG